MLVRAPDVDLSDRIVVDRLPLLEVRPAEEWRYQPVVRLDGREPARDGREPVICVLVHRLVERIEVPLSIPTVVDQVSHETAKFNIVLRVRDHVRRHPRIFQIRPGLRRLQIDGNAVRRDLVLKQEFVVLLVQVRLPCRVVRHAVRASDGIGGDPECRDALGCHRQREIPHVQSDRDLARCQTIPRYADSALIVARRAVLGNPHSDPHRLRLTGQEVERPQRGKGIRIGNRRILDRNIPDESERDVVGGDDTLSGRVLQCRCLDPDIRNGVELCPQGNLERLPLPAGREESRAGHLLLRRHGVPKHLGRRMFDPDAALPGAACRARGEQQYGSNQHQEQQIVNLHHVAPCKLRRSFPGSGPAGLLGLVTDLGQDRSPAPKPGQEISELGGSARKPDPPRDLLDLTQPDIT